MMMFFKGLEFLPMVALGLIALFFDAIYAIYQSILQTKQEGKAYTLNSSLYLLLNAIFNIIYIVFIQLGGISLVLSLLCTNIVFSIYSIYRLLNKRIMVFCLDGKIIKTALKYSLPILPHDLSNNISNYLSKIILNVNISYAVSGLFTVATQISSIMNLVQSSINLAFRPWFNEQMNLGVEGKKNIKKFSIFVFSIYGFVSLCIAYFCQELLYIFVSQEYLASWKVVPMLLMSLVISFIYYIHILTIMYNLKASRFVFACSLTGCIANILFSLLLIPRFSIMGAGVAKLLSQIILAAVTVIISRKTEYVDFGLRIMIQQTGFIVAMMLTGLYFGYLHNLSGFIWLNILYKLLLLIFGGTVLFWRQRKETYYLFMRFIHRVKRK
jgi:O-antigen/teichoic acid export membrane protein